MKIKNISIDKRPREKAFLYGFDCLNDYEVLAVIIGSGTTKYNAIDLSKNIIDKYKNLETISSLTINELTSFDGIGKTKALKILAIFELLERIKNEKFFILDKKVLNFIDIKDYCFNEFKNKKEEELIIILISEDNKIYKILKNDGDEQNVSINQKHLIETLIKNKIRKFILCHNHIYSNEEPSLNDLEYYELLKEKCKILNLCIVDYVIIYQEKYFSFYEEKIL